MVVTLCYSMTYGGLSGIVDDFFIRPAFRRAGLGKAAMAEVRSFCASRGVRAIHVETGRDNAAVLAAGGSPGTPTAVGKSCGRLGVIHPSQATLAKVCQAYADARYYRPRAGQTR